MERIENAADLSGLRSEYDDDPGEFRVSDDPFAWFGRWFDEAADAEAEPNAMVLATVDESGVPRQRTVLLKGYDASGFTFYTNYTSDKGIHIAANPKVGLLFGWYRLHRQVIVSGRAYPVPRDRSRAYFATRPRGSQVAAWASAQSRPIPGRQQLESAFAEVDARFPGEVPTPPHWGGYLVEPEVIEFWQGRGSRLHDRVRYHRESPGWVPVRLAP